MQHPFAGLLPAPVVIANEPAPLLDELELEEVAAGKPRSNTSSTMALGEEGGSSDTEPSAVGTVPSTWGLLGGGASKPISLKGKKKLTAKDFKINK